MTRPVASAPAAAPEPSSNQQRAAEIASTVYLVLPQHDQLTARVTAALDAAEARRDEVWKAKVEALATYWTSRGWPAHDLRALVAEVSAPAAEQAGDAR